MKKALTAAIGALLLALTVTSAHAQDDDDSGSDQSEDSGQSQEVYLKEYSDKADLNLLARMLGDIARAAAGQIELADIAPDAEDAGPENPEDTDSILSSIMKVYLLGIFFIAGMMILALLFLMSIQAGVEGKIINQRYNEWAALRAIFAVMAIMPILGGWSAGQYGVLNASFYMNTITNEMHRVGNRWTYAKGTAGAFEFDPFDYRTVIQDMYLNELCAQVNNNTVAKQKEMARQKSLEATENIEGYEWSDRQRDALEDAKSYIESLRMNDAFSQIEADPDVLKSTESQDFTVIEEEATEHRCGGRALDRTCTKTETREYIDMNLSMKWGSDQHPDTCGSLNLDFGEYDIGKTGRYQLESAKALFAAHKKALLNLYNKKSNSIKKNITHVKDAINALNREANDQDYTKIEREEALMALAQNDPLVAAFGAAFDSLARSHVTALDTQIDQHVGPYLKTVRAAFNESLEKRARLFEGLVEELNRRQQLGSQDTYEEVVTAGDQTNPYETVNPESSLPEALKPIAAPDHKTNALLENTRKGWMYAGFKWWNLSRAMTNQKALENKTPTVELYYKNRGAETDLGSREIERAHTIIMETLRNRQYNDYNLVVDGATKRPGINTVDYFNKVSAKVATATDVETEYGKKVGGKVLDWTFGAMYDLENRDLLASLQDAGHKYINTAWVIAGIGAVGNLFGSTLKVKNALNKGALTTGSGVGDAAMDALGNMFHLAAILFGVGVLFAVYLPMLPAIMWTFGVLSWVEKLLSLILNLPIWMLGHIIPDGGNLINSVGRQGYVLLASVLLKPPVMILALHLSMLALGAINFVLMDLIEMVYYNLNAEYMAGITITIASFVIFSGFMVVLVHLILAWIYKMPDEITHFLGSHAGGYGDSEGKGHMGGIATTIQSRSESAGSGTMKAMTSSKNKPTTGSRGFAQ